MWRDSNGFKHNGPSPYQQRKLEEYRKSVENEELKENKIKEGFIKRACKWMECIDFEMEYQYTDNDGYTFFNADKFIEDFRKVMEE